MKRLLVLLLILALAGVASATSLNFQNPSDNTSIRSFTVGSPSQSSVTWIESSTGGNNVVRVRNQGSYTFTGFALASPYQTTYAAATYTTSTGNLDRTGATAVLYDGSRNVLYTFVPTAGMLNGYGRWEIKMSGGTAYLSINGVQIKNSTPLAQNPSYVAFGTTGQSEGGYGTDDVYTYWDNYVYGQTENTNIMGVPESDAEMFVIYQDMTNSASSGLAFGSNGTIVDSNYMTSTWGRGNHTISPDPQPNQTIQLVNYVGGQVYDTRYTDTEYTGSITWDIQTKIIAAGAPMGLYATYMPGTGAYSNQIWYKSNGATVAWSADTYSRGDTATIISYVASGGYWNTANTYKICVMDVYGNFHGENTTITTQSGTTTHTWSDSDDPGVYYAVMFTTVPTGTEYILGFDWTTLSSYAGYGGWVNNAQTGTIISGASVNMTQDGVSGNSTSGPDGNWSSGSVFSTGAVLMINASASGYVPYNYSWTPLVARTVSGLNISMVPSTPAYTGLAIGGVDRDFLYGRPIEGATVTVRNTTTGLYCYKTTSFTGWYLNDETDCIFQSKTPYDVWAYKIGYSNSTTERAVTV